MAVGAACNSISARKRDGRCFEESRPRLRDWAPVKQMVYQKGGKRARALFDRAALPHREQAIRNTLKREGLWLR